MSRARSAGAAVAVAFAAFAAAAAHAAFKPLSHVPIGAPAPAFSVLGADGARHSLSDYAGKVVVLEWTSPACPFTAQKYESGEMQRLQRSAAAKGFVWLSVATGARGKPSYLTAAEARGRLVRTRAQVTAFLFDRDGNLGRAYGAKTTPSVFIVGRDGRLAYAGAVDADGDGSGRRTENYVAAALDDLAAGRSVRTPFSRPYGCQVDY